MDLTPEELQFLSIPDILRESISIPKQSPKTVSLITLTVILPLSFAILAHSLFVDPILDNYPTNDPSTNHHELTLLLVFQLCYLIFLFAFSLLSTAAVVFTVASLYTSKPVSFSATVSAVPKVLKRLFITFAFVVPLMLAYNVVFLVFLVVLLIIALNTPQNSILVLLLVVVVLVLFVVIHVYITALWHMASVVSVLEPVFGLSAMKKSYELLQGKVVDAGVLVFGYLAVCGVIESVFESVVVHGGESSNYGVIARVAVGGVLVAVLVVVNLVGLFVQSVFYYVCKSYHHEDIDKMALHDLLEGYLGGYVPLKGSNIQLESLNAGAM